MDDEIHWLLGLKLILVQKIDYQSRCDQVLSGEDAIEAVRISQAYGVSYQFIFIDIQMAGIDGFSASREIIRILEQEYRFNAQQLPTIVGLSGRDDAEYQRKAREAGMVRLLSKPINYLDVAGLIDASGQDLGP